MNAPIRLMTEERRMVEKTCERHGAFTSYRLGDDRWSGCVKCEEEDQRAAGRLKHCGLQGRFLAATFETFEASTEEQHAVLQQCRRFVSDLKKNEWRTLWLIGRPGTGKTHLGAAMVRATLFSRRVMARMHTARGIVRELRDTWRKGANETEAQVVERLADTPLLVIDEVGVGFGSDAELVQLLDVIDQRYQLQRATVVISNLNMPLLTQALGERLIDRLRENSTVLVCDWSSYRAGGGAP